MDGSGVTQPVSGTFWQATQPVSGPLTDTQLRALANTAGSELTYTCVPPGNGTRIGGPANWDEFTQWQWMTIKDKPNPYPF